MFYSSPQKNSTISSFSISNVFFLSTEKTSLSWSTSFALTFTEAFVKKLSFDYLNLTFFSSFLKDSSNFSSSSNISYSLLSSLDSSYGFSLIASFGKLIFACLNPYSSLQIGFTAFMIFLTGNESLVCFIFLLTMSFSSNFLTWKPICYINFISYISCVW